MAYNQEHGITARSIRKAIRRGIEQELAASKTARSAVGLATDTEQHDRDELIRILTEEMLEAAQRLEFEKAAEIRDQIEVLKSMPQLRPRGGGLVAPKLGTATDFPGGLRTATPRRRKSVAVPNFSPLSVGRPGSAGGIDEPPAGGCRSR